MDEYIYRIDIFCPKKLSIDKVEKEGKERKSMELIYSCSCHRKYRLIAKFRSIDP